MSGTLTRPQAEIVAEIIISLGLGSIVEEVPVNQLYWPVYAITHGSDIDRLVCVYNTAGRLDGSKQSNGEIQEMFGIQIKVRDISIPSGYSKISAIAKSLDEYYNITPIAIEDSQFIVYALTRTSPVLFIGFEQPENVLPLFTANYTVSIRQIT